MEEVWKEIPDHPGCKISSFGRFMRNNKINDFSQNKGTYVAILQQPVHSLVAKIFIGDRPDSYVVNHKDRDTRNNKASNLEYITVCENSQHWRTVKRPGNNFMATLAIKDIDGKIYRKFKTACAANGIQMRLAIIELMKQYGNQIK